MKGFRNNKTKHFSILFLVHALRKYRKTLKIRISDYWKADLCAIGFRKGNIIMYISTNNYITNNYYMNNSQLYDCDIELIKSSLDDYVVVESYRAINFEFLLRIIDRIYK